MRTQPRESVRPAAVGPVLTLASSSSATATPPSGAWLAASVARTQSSAGKPGATRSPSAATSSWIDPSRRANRSHPLAPATISRAGGGRGGAARENGRAAAHVELDAVGARERERDLGHAVAVRRCVRLRRRVGGAGHDGQVDACHRLARTLVLVEDDDLPGEGRRVRRRRRPVHDGRAHAAARADPQADGHRRHRHGRRQDEEQPRKTGACKERDSSLIVR